MEQVIDKLREVEKLTGRGMPIPLSKVGSPVRPRRSLDMLHGDSDLCGRQSPIPGEG